MKDILIHRYRILGSCRLSNFFWTLGIFLASCFFFKVSYDSYWLMKNNIIGNINSEISFFPQGLVMGFYACLGLIFTIYSFLSIILQIGYGFNEFNRKENIIRIFRWGFPGKNRRIEACYSLNDIKSVKIFSNYQKTICLCLKNDSEIILVRESFFDSIQIMEEQATNIAYFLGVPLIYN
jgi:hypothetical protein